MICFQFLWYLWSSTTKKELDTINTLLWFAFNFFDIFGLLQQNGRRWKTRSSCDLLSISLISLVFYNNREEFAYSDIVVICFQFLWYLWSSTTNANNLIAAIQLWFAFNFFDIFGLLQPIRSKLCYRKRCDLLSISLISLVFYNNPKFLLCGTSVVICFQFLWYLWSSTTPFQFGWIPFRLWFAFNFFDIFGLLQPGIR